MSDTKIIEEASERKAVVKKPVYKRRWFKIASVFLVLFVVFVGPWPVYRDHYEGSDYAVSTFNRIASIKSTSPISPIMVGIGRVDITPPVGEPLAGFAVRYPKKSEGIDGKLFAKAITIASNKKVVTIVGGDILLFLPQLRQAVLGLTNLSPEDVYFTASHSHCGPGGYSSKLLYQYACLGDFDQAILHRLAKQFAEAITKSRKSENFLPARIVSGSLGVSGVAENRILREMVDGVPLIAVTLVSPEGKHLASLITFDAHPTTLGSRDMEVGGSYPEILTQALEKKFGSTVLFSAGAVASIAVTCHHSRQGKPRRDWAISKILPSAEKLLTKLIAEHKAAPDKIKLDSNIIDVDLPPQQYRISRNLRLSRMIGWYLHDRSSYIHALRVGNVIFIGMPCDYSAELTTDLRQHWASKGVTVIFTSFNGDYIGYLVPEKHYNLGAYEVMTTSLFGPWCGDYFQEMSENIIEQMMND